MNDLNNSFSSLEKLKSVIKDEYQKSLTINKLYENALAFTVGSPEYLEVFGKIFEEHYSKHFEDGEFQSKVNEFIQTIKTENANFYEIAAEMADMQMKTFREKIQPLIDEAKLGEAEINEQIKALEFYTLVQTLNIALALIIMDDIWNENEHAIFEFIDHNKNNKVVQSFLDKAKKLRES